MPAYSRITLTELKDRLTAKVGNNTTFWVMPRRKMPLTRPFVFWQLFTGEFFKTFSINADGSAFYELPKQIGSTQRILWNGTPLV